MDQKNASVMRLEGHRGDCRQHHAVEHFVHSAAEDLAEHVGAKAAAEGGTRRLPPAWHSVHSTGAGSALN
jgi:hypothetical protein